MHYSLTLTVDQSLSELTSSQGPLPFIHAPCDCQKNISYVLFVLKVTGDIPELFMNPIKCGRGSYLCRAEMEQRLRVVNSAKPTKWQRKSET